MSLSDSLMFFLCIVGLPVAAVIVCLIIHKINQARGQEEAKLAEEENNGEPVQYVKLKDKTHGGVLSFIGSALTIIMWALVYSGNLMQEETLATAIRSGFITNPLNLLGIASLLSAFGWLFHDASITLLAAITLVGLVLVDITGWFVLIPAIVLAFAYERMKQRYALEVKK